MPGEGCWAALVHARCSPALPAVPIERAGGQPKATGEQLGARTIFHPRACLQRVWVCPDFAEGGRRQAASVQHTALRLGWDRGRGAIALLFYSSVEQFEEELLHPAGNLTTKALQGERALKAGEAESRRP